MILAKEFYPRREIPIRRAKRNEYRYLHPSIPDEIREHTRDYNMLARVYSDGSILGVVCAWLDVYKKIHRTGKSTFLSRANLKIDPTAPLLHPIFAIHQ